jgi:hypothetical protein
VKQKTALVIATPTAVNGSVSGASLRVATIRHLLEEAGCSTTVVSSATAGTHLEQSWDIVALVSYSTAIRATAARKQCKLLWLDCTDSWKLSRLSMARHGSIVEVLKYLRDWLILSRTPKLDLITFISDRDRRAEHRWLARRGPAFVIPNRLPREMVKKSDTARLVFVGSGNYGPNRRAIKFLRHVVDQLPANIFIDVFGNTPKGKSHSRLRFHGYAESGALYSEEDIHLVPITSGAGIKNKSAIPLSLGLRVIATSEGANGLAKNENLFIENDPHGFAARILQLVAEPAAGRSIGSIFEVDETTDFWTALHRASENY